MMVVVDTSILVEALRGRAPWAGIVRGHLEASTMATTTVNLAELWDGAFTPKRRKAVAALLAGAELLDLDEPAALAAGAVRRHLRSHPRRLASSALLLPRWAAMNTDASKTRAGLMARRSRRPGRAPRAAGGAARPPCPARPPPRRETGGARTW